MNYAAIIHESKSNLSYAVDDRTIHLRIKVAKGEADSITVRAVDPFNWFPSKKDPDKYEFDYNSIVDIPMNKEQETDYYDIWFAEITGFIWSRIRYGFVIRNKNEEIFFGNHKIVDISQNLEAINDIWNYFNFPYINEEDIYKAPEWVENTIWYQIFPYSFSYNGEEATAYKHGNIKGIITKLDYLKYLGISGIYLTPIFFAESSHKYDTIDYFLVDPELGSNQQLKELVHEAHKRDIKIMLDAVFNHCGSSHPFWKDVLEKGDKSKYFDYFYIVDQNKKPQDNIVFKDRKYCNYRTFGFVKNMPKWNLSNPKVKEYLLNVAVYWIKECDIDGWRLDVANEISHEFWRDFRKSVKDIKQDIYILGENWDRSMPWLRGDQFDAVMNYEFMNPVWAFLGKCETGKERHDSYNATQFMYAINDLCAYYPKPIQKVLFNLLDSHDTARLTSICKNDIRLVTLAYVFQLTFGGCPSIYYGSEVGLDGDEGNNRKYYPWTRNTEDNILRTNIKRLITLRKQLPSLRSIDFSWVLADNSSGTVIYCKQKNAEKTYIILHNNDEISEIILPDELANKEFIDCYAQEKICLKDRRT